MQFQLRRFLSQISMGLSQNLKSHPEGNLPAVQVELHWNYVWDSMDSHMKLLPVQLSRYLTSSATAESSSSQR